MIQEAGNFRVIQWSNCLLFLFILQKSLYFTMCSSSSIDSLIIVVYNFTFLTYKLHSNTGMHNKLGSSFQLFYTVACMCMESTWESLTGKTIRQKLINLSVSVWLSVEKDKMKCLPVSNYYSFCFSWYKWSVFC